MRNFPKVSSDRDELENKFVQGALTLTKTFAKERPDFTAQCFREAAQAEAEWLKRVEQIPARKKIFHLAIVTVDPRQ